MNEEIQEKINNCSLNTLERMCYIYDVFNGRNINCYWVTQEQRIKLVGEINTHEFIAQTLLKI